MHFWVLSRSTLRGEWGLGSPGTSRATTIYHGVSTRNLVFCFSWLSVSGPWLLWVLESLAPRAGGDVTLENAGREPEEERESVRGHTPVSSDWYLGVRPCSFLQLWDFTSEVTCGHWVGGHHLGGGLEKQPWMWGGAVRWRRGETRALNTAEGKKEKKKHILPCFFWFFFFIYAMEKPPWRCHGRACTGPALGRCRCVWGGSCLCPGLSHMLSRRTLLQAGHGFLSPASSPPGRGSAGPSA